MVRTKTSGGFRFPLVISTPEVAIDIDSTAFALPCAIPVDAVNVGTSTTESRFTPLMIQLTSASRRVGSV
jgi:hypothetical protein